MTLCLALCWPLRISALWHGPHFQMGNRLREFQQCCAGDRAEAWPRCGRWLNLSLRAGSDLSPWGGRSGALGAGKRLAVVTSTDVQLWPLGFCPDRSSGESQGKCGPKGTSRAQTQGHPPPHPPCLCVAPAAGLRGLWQRPSWARPSSLPGCSHLPQSLAQEMKYSSRTYWLLQRLLGKRKRD